MTTRIGCWLPFLRVSTEQAHEFLVDPAVALARTGRQTLPVEDGEFPPAVADQAFLLEGFENLGDSGTPHAEHLGEELVRHREYVRVRPVLGHQQPAATALVNRVKAVASYRL